MTASVVVSAQCECVCMPSTNIFLLLCFETEGVNSHAEVEAD